MVKVTVDPEYIPGILRVRWECTLDWTPVDHNLMIFTSISHLDFQSTYWHVLGGERKLEYEKKTQMDTERTCEPGTLEL